MGFDLDDDELRVTREDFFKRGMRPRIELRRKCKYCDLESGGFEYLTENQNLKIERHLNDFFIIDEKSEDEVKIHFCPFCGRRLV